MALLAFDLAEGSTCVVDLHSVTDAELVQLAGRSLTPAKVRFITGSYHLVDAGYTAR